MYSKLLMAQHLKKTKENILKRKRMKKEDYDRELKLKKLRRQEGDHDHTLNGTVLKKWKIKVGQKYDVLGLLSSPNRDYLIKNNGDKVKIKELSGKHMVVYFLWLSEDITKTILYTDLQEIYQAYNPVGKFEVVFVALGNDEKVFWHSFSQVPWLAIPHEDEAARHLFRVSFSIPFFGTSVLFAPDGTVLIENCEDDFREFGVEGFPFSKKRMREISRNHKALWDKLVTNKQRLSLNTLLGDYVIDNKGNQVSTSLLEGKTVGLYFFEANTWGFERTRQVYKIWKQVKDRHYDDFEIVFVNHYDCHHLLAKEEFKTKFRRPIPWYSLPVDGRKLCSIFRIGLYECDDDLEDAGFLIILKPDRFQPLSYFAYDIMGEFGIDAYPFTMEKAVMIEKAKQEKLSLGKLLSPSTRLRRVCSSCVKEDTTVCKLFGKRVLLFFASHSCFKSGLFLSQLKRIYCEKKGTEDDFEIIYISLDCYPSLFRKSIKEMSWLIRAYNPRFADSLLEKVFELPVNLPAIAAFGPDGHLETKESNLGYKKVWNQNYPFIEADMCNEVYRELKVKYNWDLYKLKG